MCAKVGSRFSRKTQQYVQILLLASILANRAACIPTNNALIRQSIEPMLHH
jgi:hypothetical protein